MAVQLNSTFLKVKIKSFQHFGKTLPENISDLPTGSSNTRRNLRCPPGVFNLYIDFLMRVLMNNCRKDDPTQFLINIELMQDQYAKSNDQECVTKMLLWGSCTVPWWAMWTI